MNMYYSTMHTKERDHISSGAFVRLAREIGQGAEKKIGWVRGKSVYYSTASHAVLPQVCSYTIGLGQRGLAGIMIWASRFGF
jgi:hypothetical protein